MNAHAAEIGAELRLELGAQFGRQRQAAAFAAVKATLELVAGGEPALSQTLHKWPGLNLIVLLHTASSEWPAQCWRWQACAGQVA